MSLGSHKCLQWIYDILLLCICSFKSMIFWCFVLKINYLLTLLLWDPQCSWKGRLLAGSLLSLKPPWHRGDRVLGNTAGQLPVDLPVSVMFPTRVSHKGHFLQPEDKRAQQAHFLLCNIHRGYAAQTLHRPSFHCSALVTITLNSDSQLFWISRHRTGRKCASKVGIKCYIPSLLK